MAACCGTSEPAERGARRRSYETPAGIRSTAAAPVQFAGVRTVSLTPGACKQVLVRKSQNARRPALAVVGVARDNVLCGWTRRTGTVSSWRRGVVDLLVALSVTVVAAGSASAHATAHVVPPPGTPDLSQMVLQPGDFSHAGSFGQNGYVTPSLAGEVASYTRVFGPSTVRRTRFFAVEDDAHLITDARPATFVFRALNVFVRRLQGQRKIAKGFVRGFDQAAHAPLLKVSDLHFLRVHGLAVGDGSFILQATAAFKGVKLSFDVLGVRVDRALQLLFLGAIGNIRSSDARMLAQAVAKHMRSVLAAPITGTTGHS
jgi:hypothetical protein